VDIFAWLEETWKRYGEEFQDWFYSIRGKWTPLEKIEIDGIQIYLKREDLQPVGGLKYRTVAGLIHLRRDELEGKTVTTATSGNFGKALGYLARKFGFDVEFYVLKKRVDPIIRKVFSRMGELVEVPETGYCPLTGRDGGRAITNAMIQGEQPGYVYLDQHNDPRNAFGPFLTGVEIAEDIEEDEITFVMGVGTTGTIRGVTAGLRYSFGKESRCRGRASRKFQADRSQKQSRTGKFKTVQRGGEHSGNSRSTGR